MKSDLRHDPKTIGELMKTGQKPVTIEEVSAQPTLQQSEVSLKASTGYASSQEDRLFCILRMLGKDWRRYPGLVGDELAVSYSIMGW